MPRMAATRLLHNRRSSPRGPTSTGSNSGSRPRCSKCGGRKDVGCEGGVGRGGPALEAGQEALGVPGCGDRRQGLPELRAACRCRGWLRCVKVCSARGGRSRPSHLQVQVHGARAGGATPVAVPQRIGHGGEDGPAGHRVRGRGHVCKPARIAPEDLDLRVQGRKGRLCSGVCRASKPQSPNLKATQEARLVRQKKAMQP